MTRSGPDILPRQRERAMTLIELMAAMTILAALFAILFVIFRQTLMARKAVDENLSSIERATGSMDLLVRDLEQLHVYDTRAYFLIKQQDIAGHKTTSVAFACLTLLRVSEDMRQKPGLIEVAYMVGADPKQDGALTVFRRELPIETNTSTTEIRDSSQGMVLLADGLTEFNVEFLPPSSTDPNEPPPDFVTEWLGAFGADKMPQALRVRITAGGVAGRPPMTLERTVRLPIASVSKEMLQPQLQNAVNNAVQ